MFRFIIILISFFPSLTFACSCLYIISFCENIREDSNVGGFQIIDSYFDPENRHFLDAVLLDEMLGEIPADTVTMYTGRGTSCDPFPESFSIGDTIVAIINQGNPPVSPNNHFTFRISNACSINYGVVSNGRLGPINYQDYLPGITDCINTTITIDKEELERISVIYPNPTSDYLKVNFFRPLKVRLTIYAANGAVITKYKSEGFQTEPLDVSQWAAGVYFIRFQVGDISAVKRFVKI